MPRKKEKPPAFQFYPKEYLSEPNTRMMTFVERGMYMDLLCFCWIDGTIPADLGALARLLQCRSSDIEAAWPALGKCFVLDVPDCTRYYHKRLRYESLKRRKFILQCSDAGQKSATKRWGRKKIFKDKVGYDSVVTTLQPKGNSASAFASPTASPIISTTEPTVPTSSDAAKSSRPPDDAYEIFSAVFLEILGGQYVNSNGDFVKLSALRKSCKIGTKETPPKWEISCRNYINSPQSKHTLCDFASRYAEFINGSHDRFKVPANAPVRRSQTFKEFKSDAIEQAKRVRELI
jgi:uncharacterized protein YdaU (DUF1376 family)